MSRSPMISKPSPARVLPRAVAAAMPEARWRPGLADHPFHSEIFAPATEASDFQRSSSVEFITLSPQEPSPARRPVGSVDPVDANWLKSIGSGSFNAKMMEK
jgi:hypothetical protein